MTSYRIDLTHALCRETNNVKGTHSVHTETFLEISESVSSFFAQRFLSHSDSRAIHSDIHFRSERTHSKIQRLVYIGL